MRLLRWGLPAVAVLIAIGVVLALTLPGGGGGSSPSAASTNGPGGSSSGAPVSPTDTDPMPTGSPSPAVEAAAPTVVQRPGTAASERTVAGETVGFTAPASWADGVSVRVSEAHQRKTSGTGPGALAGQPQTLLTLVITDGSSTALDLDGVVVQASYGSPAKQASPLYDDDTADFGGTLQPGKTATAVYSFAIPADQVGNVRMTVDVDGHRFPVVFTGAVPVR